MRRRPRRPHGANLFRHQRQVDVSAGRGHKYLGPEDAPLTPVYSSGARSSRPPSKRQGNDHGHEKKQSPPRRPRTEGEPGELTQSPTTTTCRSSTGQFRLPNNARVAVSYINIEHFRTTSRHIIPGHAAVQPRSAELRLARLRQPGRPVEMIDLMDDCGMRGTVCQIRIIRECADHQRQPPKWAYIGHGINNASQFPEQHRREGTADHRRPRCDEAARPRSWLRPHQQHAEHLADYGVEYLCVYGRRPSLPLNVRRAA